MNMERQPKLEKATVPSLEGAVSLEEQERLVFLEEWEKNCTPEQMEQILSKVQDLGRNGIAYAREVQLLDRDILDDIRDIEDEYRELIKTTPEISGIPISDFYKRRYDIYDKYLFPKQLTSGLEKLQRALTQGLMGGAGQLSLHSAQDYRNVIAKRSANERLVHFNITGRTLAYNGKEWDPEHPELEGFLEIGSTDYSLGRDRLTILFDISDLEETSRGNGHFDVGHDRAISKTFTVGNISESNIEDVDRTRMFNKVSRGERITEHDEDGAGAIVRQDGSRYTIRAKPEYGFITASRIAPRQFRGIMYCPIKSGWAEFYADDELQRIIRNIAATMVMTDEKTPERLIPIYDSRGRLLWPRLMSYEEVKSFVEKEEPAKQKTTGDIG